MLDRKETYLSRTIEGQTVGTRERIIIMMKSLYSGVSGLKTHNQRMDVIGNNIANVNTTGYKTSTVTFKDIYYQTKANASSGSATQGGVNPTQVGYGSALGTINQVMTQSGFTYSDSVYDCAIQGEGFFQVTDEAGNIFYTRSGVFSVDNAGNLTDPNGYIVLGVSGDPTGTDPSSQRINLYVPSVDNSVASATKIIDGYELTISAAGYGTGGNMSVNLTNSTTPYATLNGSTLNVQLDLTADYANVQEFEDAVNAAIIAGGVELGNDVIPLSFNFDSLPVNTSAVNAANSIDLTAGTDVLTLTFTADKAGAAQNAYEVDVKVSSTATAVTAKWVDDVLTVSLPETANGTFTLDDIQNAIYEAAGATQTAGVWSGGDTAKYITVTSSGAAVNGFDTTTALGDKTVRVGLTGGEDNFFNTVATMLATVKLQNGRVASDQSVADLDSVFIDSDGSIYGVHSVHGTFLLGRIDVVTFENPTGLLQVGTSYWQESLASGAAQVKIAGTDGSGEIVSGALEMSNVDLSQEFSDMIITQRGFQANSRIITVSDTMLEELINLKR